MAEVTCGWSGCNGVVEAQLDGRRLCLKHFHNLAAKRLDEYRKHLKQIGPAGEERTAISQFLSELISQTTTLAASAKILSPQQRHELFELSLSAAELHKRVQRGRRIPRNMPVLIYREKDSVSGKELTNTIDISKRGASVATGRLWTAGEEIWVEKPENGGRVQARVAWVKKNAPLQFVVGLEILDHEDFWELEKSLPKQGR